MRSKNGSKNSKAASQINTRTFFEAINTLIASGKLEGMKTFCNLYDLHQPKYSRLRSATMDTTKECPYKLIDIDALAYLVKDFGVSSDWLLLGRGKMFK